MKRRTTRNAIYSVATASFLLAATPGDPPPDRPAAATHGATLPPDEGQWLPQQILAMDWADLRARGMRLTKDEFWHPEKGGVLSAAVQINGCTASFCSPTGLVVTNHHCGFGAINGLSTPERNYLRDGFVANTGSEELPAPGVTVQIVRRIENVTEQIRAAQAQAATDLERYQLTQAIKRQLIAAGEQEPDTVCSIADFFEGREYHLYYRTKLTDVRLVYAPPRAVGEYGGEFDNWEWPRHTGDFSFFRAYAAPDGTPRDYDEANVPYRPEHFLPVSREGVRDGDLAIIMGYPGRTERYETSLAVQDREGYLYPKRLDVFSRILDVLRAQASTDDAAELRYASTIKSIANVQKNAAGMVWGLARNGVVARKQLEEEQFGAWVHASTERAENYGGVLEDLRAIDRLARQTQEQDLLLGLALSPRVNPLLGSLVTMVATTRRLEPVEDAQSLRPSLRERFGPNMNQDFDTVQRPLLTILVDEMQDLPDGQRLAGTDDWDRTEPPAEIVDRLLGTSDIVDPEARLRLLSGGARAIAESQDPLIVLARALLGAANERSLRMRERAGRRIAVGTRWIEAQEEWRGTAFYPDANSTMRVSIATIKGYQPRDGVRYVPHTTVAGLLAKHTGEEPFDAPDALLAAAKHRKQSSYFDWRIGDVPVCFLSDGDTTGGNSGSPVVNGRGELVGLNFDRAFESVSGDYGWNAERSRNISVDIRFVLWVLEQVQPAHHLLDEMGVR